jgi:hypothetical protein
MINSKKITDRGFKEGPDGKVVFYPTAWKGYILETEEQEQKLRSLFKKQVKSARFCMWVVLVFNISLFFILTAHFQENSKLWTGTFLISYIIFALSLSLNYLIRTYIYRYKIKKITKTLMPLNLSFKEKKKKILIAVVVFLVWIIAMAFLLHK